MQRRPNHWREKAQRNARTALIHKLAAQQGLDDDAYRDMLQAHTGKRSCKACSLDELGSVLDHLTGKPRRVPLVDSPKAQPGAELQFGKVSALLAALGKPWAYAEGCAHKMYGKQKLEFCTGEELRGVIAALQKAANRAKAVAAA